MPEKKEDFISKVPIFQNLSAQISKKIIGLFETVEFAPGQTIFSEGAVGDALYIIVEGEVEIVKSLSQRQGLGAPPTGSGRTGERGLAEALESGEKLISTLSAGEFFGEMALLEETVRSATARSKGKVKLLKVEREKFWKLVKSDAKIAFQTFLPLAKTLSERLRQTTLELAILFDLGKLFASGLSQKELCLGIVSHLKTILPENSFASIALYNEFNEELEWVAVSSRENFSNELKRTIPISEPLPKILSESRQPFFSIAWKEEARLTPEEKKLYGSYAGSVLVVPFLRTQESQLLASGRWIQIYPLIGFLFIASSSSTVGFDKNFVHLMNSLSHLASTSLESAAYRQEETTRHRYLLERQSEPKTV